jgi:beta-carotene hydroxylase
MREAEAESGGREAPIKLDRTWLGAAKSTWANPTVGLMLLALTLMVGGPWAWLALGLPREVATLACMIACYVSFTVMHEAVHGVAHANKGVNGLLGRVAATLLYSPFRSFRAIHLEHHSHTNDPERDPDFGVSRRPRFLLPLHCLGILVDYRRHFYGRPLWRSRGELTEVLVNEALLLGVTAAALSMPATREWFVWCWLVPALGAATVLAYAFDYLPHVPHEGRGRYRDTRAYPGPVLHALLLAQNYHLVHHLWTTIPWFRYRRAFEGVRPELEQRGCRID